MISYASGFRYGCLHFSGWDLGRFSLAGGLVSSIIFASSGGYGTGRDRSFSGLFMDLFCSDFLCRWFLGMDVSTFLVEILGVFRWRVVWRFPLSSHHLVVTELAGIGVFWVVCGLALL